MVILYIILFSSLTMAQTMNVHPVSGMDVDNLADTDSITFTVSSDTGIVTDIDGNIYHKVAIGTQVWLVENLKVTHYRNGDPIPNVTDGSQWIGLNTGAYCNYYNDSTNANTYGRLYNWYAVDDPRGLAPEGWHVPSLAEWHTLVDFLGGDLVAGGAMKDTILWQLPNTGATNSSGFSALPGGCHNDGYSYDSYDYDSNFHSMTYSTYFFSSSDYLLPTHAWICCLSSYDPRVLCPTNYKQGGYSVRCVRD